MDVRLVAYRPAESGDTVETTYELELLQSPNISLNFQFSDIKNPEARKGSFSQTFKLPFTKKNNAFFQDWYNVNLEKLVFTTREQFSAVLLVDTVPQLEGYLQLKGVYKKAQVYEVVLMSNTSDLYSAIGEKRLKDVFLNDDGTYSNELNHIFDKTNILASWDGSSSDFENVDEVSLRDADAGVQKVMYPLTATRPNFWYSEGDKSYLNLDDTEIAAIIADEGEYYGNLTAQSLSTNIEQLRPAIQIKTLLKLIFARAGFSYRSTFVDGNYFGKIFMTLAGHSESELLPTPSAGTQDYPPGILYSRSLSSTLPWWGNAAAGVDLGSTGMIEMPFENWGTPSNFDCDNAEDVDTPPPITFIANSDYYDDSEVWDTSVFTKISVAITEVTIEGRFDTFNIVPVCGSLSSTPIEIYLYDANTGDIMNDSLQTIYVNLSDVGNEYIGANDDYWECTFDISDLAVGTQFSFGIQPPKMKWYSIDYPLYRSWFKMFGSSMGGGVYSKIKCNWLPYNQTQWEKEILIPDCIDPEITQKEFLQDIIQRFNLVVTTDPDNSSNIIIEPYELYIEGGTMKHWTDKLDTSKEVIVKDTTSLQKKIVHFSDQEDEDIMNKTIKENAPSLNVYGKYLEENKFNQFATGEMKNTPLFAPYINQQIFKIGSETETDLSNVAIHYEMSYEVDDDGTTQNVLTATKPKLFYYCGATTDIKTAEGTAQTIYLHQITPGGTINARSFTKYPLCSPWDINTNAAAPTYEYTLTSANTSLYWDFAPPQANLRVFNYEADLETITNLNTLYMYYWKPYLNGLYSEESRVLIAYFNLSAVDIFKFKFNDEIFIRDSWWRIQNIHNYQVGTNSSTKVTLLKKIDDAVALPEGCDSVVSDIVQGFFTWCDATDPSCDATVLPDAGLYVSEACCFGAGGEPVPWANDSYPGLFPCLANTGSLPIRLKSTISKRSLFNKGYLKNLMSGKLRGLKNPFVVGTNSGKGRSKLIQAQGDSMIIKYKNELKTGPAILGESHRMVLTGYTEGTTTGYAYPQGNKWATSNKIFLPQNSNVMISVKGMSTVVGGTDSTYVVGTTESFSYHTAFVVQGSAINQIGNVGGVQEWGLKEATLSTTSTLEIITNSTDGSLEFGLKDSLADTKKAWSLVVDLNVQSLGNLQLPFGDNWAIWQSGGPIGLQNFERLIWN